MKIFRYTGTPIYFCLFLGALWLLHLNVSSQSFLTKDAKIDIDDGALIMREDSMGLYLGNRKSGYSYFVLKEESTQSDTKTPGKNFQFESRSLLQVIMMGFPVEILVKQKGIVNEDLSLRSFLFNFEGSGQKLGMKGEVRGSKLFLSTQSEGEWVRDSIDIEPPIYHTDMVHLVLAREGLEVGKKRTFRVYDPMAKKQEVSLTVQEETTLILPSGKKVDAFKVDLNLKGFHSTIWMNEDGDMFKQTGSMGGVEFIGVYEKLEDARDMNYISKGIEAAKDAEQPDITKEASIKPNVYIADPQNVTKMKIELIGAKPGEVLFDNSYQTLLEAKENALIIQTQQLDYDGIIGALPRKSPPYHMANSELEPYLKESSLIQSTNPRIRKQALEITLGLPNVWASAEAIATWLNENMRDEYRVTIPSAIEVLTSMRGDCNEHSTLFAALARSIGIPTKIIGGLVYQDGAYYYHAWNEVYIGDRWLPIDSTLDRIRMDAAHVKIAEGLEDNQAEIIGLVGNIDIKILDYEK